MMETLRSFALYLTPELMLVQQGRDAKKGALSPGAMRVYQEVIEQARALVEPVALLDLFDVQAVEPDRFVLSNGHAFQSHLVIEQLARAQQVAVGVCTIGPRLEDQRVVFNLLPVERIGVRLTDSCVMVPVKSVSLLIGLGHNVPTRHELAQCDFCPRKDTCPSARLRTAHSFERT